MSADPTTAPTAPLSPPARARRQQKLDQLTAAALRAMAGNPRLGFRSPYAWRGGEPMAWVPPHLHSGEDDGLITYRAIADSLALRERLGDPVAGLDMVGRVAHLLHPAELAVRLHGPRQRGPAQAG